MKTTQKLMVPCVLLLILAVMFSGCAKPTEQEAEDGSEKAIDIVFAGANPSGGGTWDLIGGGIAEVIWRGVPGSSVTFVPGEGTANPVTVSKGEAELGFAQGVVAVAAANGEDPYDQKYENVRAIASLYASTGQFVVTKDSGITSIQEIIDKQIPVRIAVDNPGSTQEMTNKRLLEAYGTSYEDIESWGGQVVYKGFSDAAGMMNEGLVDALSTLTIVPAAPVQEAANNKEIVMLPIDPSVVDTMSKKYGYVADTIPASSYSFLNDDLTTLSTRCSLICSTELSEEDAYNITKAIVENLDYLRTVHNNIKELTPEEMAVGTGVPLHPGAEKYYKEIGAIN